MEKRKRCYHSIFLPWTPHGAFVYNILFISYEAQVAQKKTVCRLCLLLKRLIKKEKIAYYITTYVSVVECMTITQKDANSKPAQQKIPVIIYITSRPFLIKVRRDHFLPLVTILTHTHLSLHFHQISHTVCPFRILLTWPFSI
jgi:hypothetical protein